MQIMAQSMMTSHFLYSHVIVIIQTDHDDESLL
jgi:hypothetical protein